MFLERDFSRTQLKTIVAPGNTVHDELYFNVSLRDDSIEEPDEYFLLVLDVPQLDETVYDIDKKRQCMKLTIIADKDSKPFLIVGLNGEFYTVKKEVEISHRNWWIYLVT